MLLYMKAIRMNRVPEMIDETKFKQHILETIKPVVEEQLGRKFVGDIDIKIVDGWSDDKMISITLCISGELAPKEFASRFFGLETKIRNALTKEERADWYTRVIPRFGGGLDDCHA